MRFSMKQFVTANMKWSWAAGFALATALPAAAITPKQIDDPSADAAKPAKTAIAKPDFRATAPKAAGKISFKAPKYKTAKLKNGIPVWVVERHDLPLVAVQLWVDAGSELAPVERAGLPAFVSTLLDEGTETRSALQIADEAESLGAVLGISSSMDGATVTLNALTETLDPALDLMADVVLHPKFDQAEIDRVRNDWLGFLQQKRDTPRRMIGEIATALLFGGGHPYGLPVDGTEQSLPKISRDEIRAFYSQNYTSDRMWIVVAGDVKVADVVRRLDARFGAVAAGEKKGSLPSGVFAMQGVEVHLLDRPNAPQSEVRVATLGLARNAKDRETYEIMNTIFGGNFGARINMNLREKNGYTYGAYSRQVDRKSAGGLVAGGGIKADVTVPAIKEILNEIVGLKERAPSAEELTLAKNSVVLSLAGDFERNTQVVSALGALRAQGLPANYYDKLPAAIAKVTAAGVLASAKSTWDLSKLRIAVIGSRAQLEKALSEIEIPGAAGQKVTLKLIDDAAWKKLFP